MCVGLVGVQYKLKGEELSRKAEGNRGRGTVGPKRVMPQSSTTRSKQPDVNNP
jgi:hypothetical protein